MLEKITKLANENKKISDFHLRGGSDIAYRELGDIIIEPNSKITDKDIEELLKKNCSPEEIKKFEEKKELDTAVMLGDLRFRANFYKTLNGMASVLRRIETKIPLMEDLNLPPILFELLDTHKGLVGYRANRIWKSTTLAAIINQINEADKLILLPSKILLNSFTTIKKVLCHKERWENKQRFAHALREL